MLSTTKVKVITIGHRFAPNRSCIHNNFKTAEANLMKFQRKIKQSKKVCHTLNFVSFYPSSRSQLQVIGIFSYKPCIHDNSKMTERKLIKFHRNFHKCKTVPQAYKFSSDDQGQGHSHRSKSVLTIT